MSRRPIVSSTAVALAVFALVATACSRDDSEATSSTPPSSVEASTAPTTTTVASTTTTTSDAPTTTTAAPTTTSTTTAPTTTTAAPTTMAAPPPPETGLTLTSSGVEPFDFGDADDDVIDGLTIALGPPTSDDAQTYPNVDGSEYLDATGEESFTHPLGRRVCFVNDLCAQFGGATVDSLTFTGWDITGDGPPQLTTADGITIGSNLDGFASVATIDEGGCYSVGYGAANGVALTLQSTGTPFVEFDDDGNWVINSPDPADISVLSMSAGELPYFLFADC